MTHAQEGSPERRRRTLVWFRNDLRIADHAPLAQACAAAESVVPVYCLDPRHFGTTPNGFAKTGSLRARFLLESVLELRASLRALDSDLVIRHGHPERVLTELAQDLEVDAVHYHRDVTAEERAVESALESALDALPVASIGFDGHTLYHPCDLPPRAQQVPSVFSDFRRLVEQEASPAEPLEAPLRIPPLPALAPGNLPACSDLNLSPPQEDPRATFRFRGGESAGRQRLDDYFWQHDRLATYKETRDGLLGPDDSSRLSPWLALGCLSTRSVYHEIARYEAERVKNSSTHWLFFELLWREYFRLLAAKHGAALFRRSGIKGLSMRWNDDPVFFEAWRLGNTGVPMIDACMRELLATGYLSNRGRQYVASFLTKDLGLDWRLGAEWFESQLIDYDVCSNWGNWNYAAGVGNDPRGFRYFDILKQARQHDPRAAFVKHWLPALEPLPAGSAHAPWQQADDVRSRLNYPRPIVNLSASVNESRRRYEEAQECLKRSCNR